MRLKVSVVVRTNHRKLKMDNKELPLVTIGIAFYNHEDFAAETVAGALSQTYPNCEIILSDDCSTDNTFEVLRKAIEGYDGPHKIILNRNEKNLGLVPHVNKIYSMSSGQIFCGNGGDDIPLPSRVSDAVDYFVHDSELMALTMSYDIIDKNGEKIGENHSCKDEYMCIDDFEYLNSSSFIWGKTGRAIRREVWDCFGPMAANCQTEDSVIRFRSILLGKVLTSAKVGLKYRWHDTNLSHRLFDLNTKHIANQYRRDLDTVSASLDTTLMKMLKKKIDFYEYYRDKEFIANKQSGLKREYAKLILKLKNYIYRKRMSQLFQEYTANNNNPIE